MLLLQRPQHQTETLAVGGVHMLQELLDRDVERPRIEAELPLDLLGDGDVVLARAPLEDMGAGAVNGERFHLHEARRSELELSAGGAEGELGDGEAEQDEYEHEAGDQPRDGDVA